MSLEIAGAGYWPRSRAAGTVEHHPVQKPNAFLRKTSWVSRRLSATSSWVIMWVTPERGKTLCGLPAPSRARDREKV